MITKKSCVSRVEARVHWMTMLSIFLCSAALLCLSIMIEPELFNDPFFLGSLPFFGFILCPLFSIAAGILALTRAQTTYGRALAKVSILVDSLLILTALILLYYATQFS